MNKYEAMCIIKPDLAEQDKKILLDTINDAVTKRQGAILSSQIWAEKKKMYFPIQKFREGTYYLFNFTTAPEMIKEMKHAYKLNENILRVLITRLP